MNQRTIYVKFFLLAALFAVMFGAALPAFADSFNTSPWNFTPQNRASIAALMKSVDDQNHNNSGVTAGAVGGSVTNLVCGNGADSSTATGNSACIILNNSEGSTINTGQDTTGDQTADNTQTSSTLVNETINNPETPGEALGSVLEGLGGDTTP